MKKLLLFVFILLGFIAKSQELDELYIREELTIRDTTIINLIEEHSSTVSFGSQYEIPATNATTDDFNYDSGLRYYTDSLVVDNNSIVHGSVGIGTSSPTEALDINSNDPTLKITAGINNRTITITPSAGAIDCDDAILAFNRFSTRNVTIGANSTSNLGVGISPQSKLHINGGVGTLSTGLIIGADDDGFYQPVEDALSGQVGGKEIFRIVENVTEQLIFNPQADYTGTAAAPNSAYGDGDTGEYEVSDDVRNTTIGGTITKQETVDTLFIKNYLKVEGLSNIIGVMQVSRAEVLYTNTSQTTIITLPANAVVWNVGIEVITLFDDTGSDLVKIGITAEDNRYNTGENVSSAWSPNVREALFGNMAGVTANYADKITSSTNITFTYTGANVDATQGVAWVYIHYTTF